MNTLTSPIVIQLQARLTLVGRIIHELVALSSITLRRVDRIDNKFFRSCSLMAVISVLEAAVEKLTEPLGQVVEFGRRADNRVAHLPRIERMRTGGSQLKSSLRLLT